MPNAFPQAPPLCLSPEHQTPLPGILVKKHSRSRNPKSRRKKEIPIGRAVSPAVPVAGRSPLPRVVLGFSVLFLVGTSLVWGTSVLPTKTLAASVKDSGQSLDVDSAIVEVQALEVKSAGDLIASLDPALQNNPFNVPEEKNQVFVTPSDGMNFRRPDFATETFGTSVQFVRKPQLAMQKSRQEDKLVFLLHVSGNFEESCFT